MKKFFKNSAFGVLQTLFSIGLVFFSIPLLIKMHGISRYGVYSVIAMFGNLTSLLNLGLNTALLKFLSATDSRERKNEQVNTCMIILLAITVLLTVVIVLLKGVILDHAIKDAGMNRADVLMPFYMFLLANLFTMAGQPFIALVQSHNDFFKTSIFQWIYSTINGVGLIVFSLLHVPFRYIAIPALLASLFWLLIIAGNCIWKYRFIPGIMSFKSFRYYARQQLGYSIKVYGNSIVNFLNEPLLRIVVANFLGTVAVGRLDLVLRIKGQLVSVIVKLFEPLTLPIAASKSTREIARIVHYFEQIALLVFIPCCLLMYYTANPLLRLWMPGIDADLMAGIKITAILAVCSMAMLPNYYYLLFHDHVGDSFKIQLLNTLAALATFFAIRNVFPFNAPIICVCASIMAGFAANVYFQWKHLESIIFDKNSLLTISIIAAAIICFIVFEMDQLWYWQGIFVLLVPVVSARYIYKLWKSGSIQTLTGYMNI